MDLHNQLLFFFSALGTFNCSILAFYFLFFAKPKLKSNIFLGALLSMLSIRIWKSIFFYFNPDLAIIYLQIGLSALIFIGPFLYLYIKSKTIYPKPLKPNWKYYLTLLFLIVVVGGFIYPYSEHPGLWRNYYFFKTIYLFWFIGVLASLYLLRNSLKKVFRKGVKLEYHEVFDLNVVLGVGIIWLAYETSYYTSYIVGALSFTFALYLSLLVLFFKRKNYSIHNEMKEKYSNNKIEATEAKIISDKILVLMTHDKTFKNSNLTLAKLAKKLEVTTHILSQYLNDNLGKSFSLFINEYRIEESKKIIIENSQYTLEAIGLDAGFNSKSTFYATFKKQVGLTPAQFKNQHLPSK